MEKEFDICIVGAIGIDTNVYLYSNEVDFEKEANFSENVDNVGQAGGYCSRIMSYLGYETAFIGYIGDDFQGQYIKKILEKENIHTDGLFTDPSGTKRSVNFMYKDGRRKNFYDGKGSMQVLPDMELCEKILSKSSVVHFNIPNWARYLLPLAKKLGMKISCDIQDAYSLEDMYRKDFIEYSDILFFSGVNFKNPLKTLEDFGKIYKDKIIICSMGKDGCAVYRDEKILRQNAIESKKSIIDTNGAGDSLAMGFISAYLLENLDLDKSLKAGQILARHVCSLKNPKTDFIHRKELYKML